MGTVYMEINDSSRLKKLYQIEEKRFIERLRRYEETRHTMDTHQFYLEHVLLKKEELFYKYLPASQSCEDAIGFDYEFIHKDMGKVGWKGGEEKKLAKAARHPMETKRENRREKTKGARLYVCEIDGCDKKYTSSFGLKYHMKEGHSQEKMNVFKPFGCPFEGCGKKYKNSNGLKYHIRHYHDDQK